MKFKLFQIQLTNAEVDLINATGSHDSVPKQKARLDMSFAKDVGEKAFTAFEAGFYTHVSNITADSLDGVFHIGNMGPEKNIERLAPMSSASVSDIIEDETGNRSVIASYGFQTVQEKDEA